MSNILDTIVATKRIEVVERKKRCSADALGKKIEQAEPARGFCAALQAKAEQNAPGVIAEIKKASPSKGVVRADFDPVVIAKSYVASGATCLSVLTDEQYFQGSDQYLVDVQQCVDLPVIRKDFVVDEYQIYESRALGADCILLIAAVLNIMQLTVLYQLAKNLGLDVLIEVHNQSELEAALSLNPALIGINNRNLKDFTTSLTTTLDLLPMIPKGITVVTESGIGNADDVQLMRDNNVHCFLVGEAFMRAEDPGKALGSLFYGK